MKNRAFEYGLKGAPPSRRCPFAARALALFLPFAPVAAALAALVTPSALAAPSPGTVRTRISLPAARPSPAPDGKSLSDVYQLALKRAETVQIQDELLTQADELVSQSKGAMLPTISGSGVFLKQQTPSSTVGSSIFPSSQSTLKLTAVQPLFRGFRDFALLRQRKSHVQSQKLALQEAARRLLADTATAYYTVLALESDEFNFENQITLNQKRLKELEGYVRIGRSQDTDMLTLRSNISALEATLEATRGSLESARETLAFFSGQDRTLPIHDREALPAQIEPVAAYLARIEERPDVLSAKSALEANEESISIARGQHLPSLDLQGDYYLARPGTLSDVRWGLQLNLTLPIFQGGIVASQTRQAASVRRQYDLQLSAARRRAEQEIRQLHDAVVANQRLLAKLAESAQLGQKSYEALARQYKTGLSTNLDVLQSQSSWHDSVRLLSRQQYTAKADYVKLQAASGARPEIRIEAGAAARE
jgi:outer membrane protein